MRGLARRHRRDAERQEIWAACSAVLDYPTEELLASLDDLEALVPGNVELGNVITHLRSRDLRALQEDYVETFDHTRKCALYLTYYAYGDTRRRGAALVRFKEAYRSGGAAGTRRAASCQTTCVRFSSSGPAWTPTWPGSCSTSIAPVSRCCGSPFPAGAIATAASVLRGTERSAHCAPPCPTSPAQRPTRFGVSSNRARPLRRWVWTATAPTLQSARSPVPPSSPAR